MESRRQEDLGRMATELMTLVQVGKIRPTVAEQITLEAISKALERLAEGARPRQNCGQSPKLIRGQRRTPGPRRNRGPVRWIQRRPSRW
jgi:hypothetical protein